MKNRFFTSICLTHHVQLLFVGIACALIFVSGSLRGEDRAGSEIREKSSVAAAGPKGGRRLKTRSISAQTPGGKSAPAAGTEVNGASGAAPLPNVVVIMGDDIGYSNLGCYGGDIMGGATPNIDRLAREGLRLTSFYAQPSCTAGRAALMTGQLPIRTGLTTVGIPHSHVGISPEDPTIAEVFKSVGYATAQFGKNHLGDRNEFLPTVHGFDEFWGNLYHLSAQDYLEDPDRPGNPFMELKYGARGILNCRATTVDDPTDEPRFGRVGKQVIEKVGPLNTERMKTYDDEILAKSLDFIDRQVKQKKPFFLYLNPSRMHVFLHLKEESRLKSRASEYDLYGAGLAEHDEHVGKLLDQLDQLKVAENTIVIYTTDNGAYQYMWPEGGTTPFRGQKGTTWEGGVRVPCIIRWPGVVEAGRVSSQIFAMEDLYPTLAAAVGMDSIITDLRAGTKIGERDYQVHLDGYDQTELLTGDGDSPRREIFYYDENRLTAVRYGPWKVHFNIKRQGNWDDPLDELPVPLLFNLLMDPYERQDGDAGRVFREHKQWMLDPLLLLLQRHAQTLEDFPPRQRPDSLNVDEIMERVITSTGKSFE